MLQGYKTYIGIAVALIAAVLKQNGVELAIGDVELLNDGIANVVQMGALGFAAYGRYKAKPKTPTVEVASQGEAK